jgi:hypothetical protein
MVSDIQKGISLQKNYNKILNLISTCCNWLLFSNFSPNRKRPLPQVLCAFFFVILLGLILTIPMMLKFDFKFSTNDGHTIVAVDQAINKAICNVNSKINLQDAYKKFFIDRGDFTHTAALSISSLLPNSKDYCQKLVPYLNSENTLSWIYTFLFHLSSSITLQQLGVGILLVELFLLWFFTYYLLQIGVSIWLTEAFLLAGIILLGTMSTHLNSHYSLIQPFTVSFIALLGCCLYFRIHRYVFSIIFAMPVIGIYIFLFVNLRTSYAPIVMICLLSYLLYAFNDKEILFPFKKKLFLTFLAILMMFSGFAYAKHKLLVPMLQSVGASASSSKHPVAHPLVLGLAIPANAFANQLGLAWNDSKGLALAQRTDPAVVFGSDRYERILFNFYINLWKKTPQQMLNLYIEKFKLAGFSAYKNFDRTLQTENNLTIKYQSSFLRWILSPLKILPNGLFYLGAYLVIFILPFLLKKHLNIGARFALCTLSLAGVGVYLQSAIIMSEYVPQYDAYLVFTEVLMGLVFFQAGIDFLPVIYRKFIRKQRSSFRTKSSVEVF